MPEATLFGIPYVEYTELIITPGAYSKNIIFRQEPKVRSVGDLLTYTTAIKEMLILIVI